MSHRRFSQHGQGMTEYIVVVALVAIAGIFVYECYGAALGHEPAAVTNELAGRNSPGWLQTSEAGGDGVLSLGAVLPEGMGDYTENLAWSSDFYP